MIDKQGTMLTFRGMFTSLHLTAHLFSRAGRLHAGR